MEWFREGSKNSKPVFFFSLLVRRPRDIAYRCLMYQSIPTEGSDKTLAPSTIPSCRAIAQKASPIEWHGTRHASASGCSDPLEFPFHRRDHSLWGDLLVWIEDSLSEKDTRDRVRAEWVLLLRLGVKRDKAWVDSNFRERHLVPDTWERQMGFAGCFPVFHIIWTDVYR